METRVFTFIETDDSVAHGYHFEWHGGTTVNVMSDEPLGAEGEPIIFMEQPTEKQVIDACEAYFRS